MTFAPGKKQAHASSGSWDRDLATDLRRLREVFHVDTLVSLVEDHELQAVRIADLLAASRAAGIAVIRFPIADASVPVSLRDTGALVADIVGELRNERTVVVHCMGGLGRSGLIVACVLITLGASSSGAISSVRSARPGAIETAAQEEFVHGFRPG